MDLEVARASERVAAAADAWLRDPRDAGVYARLVAAAEAWRHLARPTLPESVDVEPDEAAAASAQRAPAHLGTVLDALRPMLHQPEPPATAAD